MNQASRLTDQPIALEPPITFWSASSIKQFETCPFNLWLARVLRCERPEIGDDPKHPLVRGSRIHAEAEAYVKGGGPLTSDLRKFKDQLEALRTQYEEGKVEVEEDWAFTRAWAPTEWLGPDCWALIKCDAVVHEESDGGPVVRIIDYKTGKRFGKEVVHGQQMGIYAVAALARYPETSLVICELWYLDEGKTSRKTYTPAQIQTLTQRVEQRANRLTDALAFPPKANRSSCRYCDFGTNVGTGVCPYAVTIE